MLGATQRDECRLMDGMPYNVVKRGNVPGDIFAQKMKKIGLISSGQLECCNLP